MRQLIDISGMPAIREIVANVTALSADQAEVSAVAQQALDAALAVRGIGSTAIVNGRLIVTYTDGTTQDAGAIGGGTPTPTPTIYFTQPTISATEGNSGTKTLTMTLMRSASVGALGATATFVQGSAGAADFAGNALPGNKVFTFADGVTSATATVGISGDTDVESDETFGYQLVAPAGYALGTPNSITGTILNDDTASLPTVSLTAASWANEGASVSAA